jgi:cytochrome c biogenesis protein CcmG/thiol:disulfide interchange protein DsbE
MEFKSSLRILLIAFLFIPILSCNDRNPAGSVGGSVMEGQHAPDFHFYFPSGQMAWLRNYRGKVVLVNFWASWCPPCLEEMPSMDALQKQMGMHQLVILAFSVDDSWKTVNHFIAQNGFTLPVYADFDRRIATLFGTSKFPETYILDKKGIVRSKVVGAEDWTSPEILELLQKLTAENH